MANEKLSKSKKVKIYSLSAAAVLLIGGGVATAAILLTDKKHRIEDEINYYVGNKVFRTRSEAEEFISAHSNPSMLPVYDGKVYPTVADAWLDAAMHVEVITDFYYASKTPTGADNSFVNFDGIHPAREGVAGNAAVGYKNVYAVAKVDPATGEPILDPLTGQPTFYLYASKTEAEAAWLALNPIKTLGVGDLSGNTYTAEQIRARNIYLSDMAFKILHPRPSRSATQEEIDEYNQLVAENYMSLVAPAGAIEGMNYPQIGDGSNREYSEEQVAARDARNAGDAAPQDAIAGLNKPQIGDGSGRTYTREQIKARDIATSMLDGSYLHDENGEEFYLSLIPSNAVAGENRPRVGAGNNQNYTVDEIKGRDAQGKIIPEDALAGINFPAIGAGNGMTYTQAQIDARDEMYPASHAGVLGFNPARVGSGDGLEYSQAQLDARDANAAPNNAVVGMNTRAHGDGSGNTYTQEQVDALNASAAPTGAVVGLNSAPVGDGSGNTYTQAQIDNRDGGGHASSVPASAEAGYNIRQVGDGSNRYYTDAHINAYNATAAPVGAETGYNYSGTGRKDGYSYSPMENLTTSGISFSHEGASIRGAIYNNQSYLTAIDGTRRFEATAVNSIFGTRDQDRSTDENFFWNLSNGYFGASQHGGMVAQFPNKNSYSMALRVPASTRGANKSIDASLTETLSFYDVAVALYIATGGDVNRKIIVNGFETPASGFAAWYWDAGTTVQQDIMTVANDPIKLAKHWDACINTTVIKSDNIINFGTPNMNVQSVKTVSGKTFPIIWNEDLNVYENNSGTAVVRHFWANLYIQMFWQSNLLDFAKNPSATPPAYSFTWSADGGDGRTTNATAYQANSAFITAFDVYAKYNYTVYGKNYKKQYNPNYSAASIPTADELAQPGWIEGGAGDNKIYTQAQIDKRDGFITKLVNPSDITTVGLMLSDAGDLWLTEAAVLSVEQRKAWWSASADITTSNPLFTQYIMPTVNGSQLSSLPALTQTDKEILSLINSSGFVKGFNVAQSYIPEDKLSSAQISSIQGGTALTEIELLTLWESQYTNGLFDVSKQAFVVSRDNNGAIVPSIGNGDNKFYTSVEVSARDAGAAPIGAIVGYNAPGIGSEDDNTYTQAEIDRREGRTLAGDYLPRRNNGKIVTDPNDPNWIAAYNPNWAPIGAVVGENTLPVGAGNNVSYTQAEIDKRNGFVELPVAPGTPGARTNALGILVINAPIAPNGAVVGINYKGSAAQGGFGDGSGKWYTQAQIDKRDGVVHNADGSISQIAPVGAVAEGSIIYFDRNTGRYIEGNDGILGSWDDAAGADGMTEAHDGIDQMGNPVLDDQGQDIDFDADNIDKGGQQQLSDITGVAKDPSNKNDQDPNYSFQGDRYIPIKVTNNSRHFVINQNNIDSAYRANQVFEPQLSYGKTESDAQGNGGGTGDGMEYTPYEIAQRGIKASTVPYEGIANGETLFFNNITGQWLASPIQQVKIGTEVFFVLGKVGTFFGEDAANSNAEIQKRYDLVGMRYQVDSTLAGDTTKYTPVSDQTGALPGYTIVTLKAGTNSNGNITGGSPEVEDPSNNPIDPSRIVRDQHQNISIYVIGDSNKNSGFQPTPLPNLNNQYNSATFTLANGYKGTIDGNQVESVFNPNTGTANLGLRNEGAGDGSGLTYSLDEINARDGIAGTFELAPRGAVGIDAVLFYDKTTMRFISGADGIVGNEDDAWGDDGISGGGDDLDRTSLPSNIQFIPLPSNGRQANTASTGDGSGNTYTQAQIDARNGYVSVYDQNGLFTEGGLQFRHDPIAPNGAINRGATLIYDHITGKFLSGEDGILGNADDSVLYNGATGYDAGLKYSEGANVNQPLHDITDEERLNDGTYRFEDIIVTSNTMGIGAGDGRIYTKAQIQARDRQNLPENTPTISQIRQHMLDLKILQPVTMGIGSTFEAKYDILGQAVAHLHNPDGTISEIPVLSPLDERNENQLFSLFNTEIRNLQEFIDHENGLAIVGLNSSQSFTTPDDFERAFAQRSTGATPDRTRSVAELQIHDDVYKALFNPDGTLQDIVDNTHGTQADTSDDTTFFLDGQGQPIRRSSDANYRIDPTSHADPITGDGLYSRQITGPNQGEVIVQNGTPQFLTSPWGLGWIYNEDLVTYSPQEVATGGANNQELVTFLGDGNGNAIDKMGTTFDIAQLQANAIVKYEELMNSNHQDGTDLTDDEKIEVADEFPDWFFNLELVDGELEASGYLVTTMPDLAGMGSNELTGIDVEIDVDDDGTIDLTNHYETIEQAYDDLIKVVDVEELPRINDTDKIWVTDPISGELVEQPNPLGGWTTEIKRDENGVPILDADGKQIFTGYMIDHNGEVKMPGLDYISDPKAQFTSWQELEAYEAAKAQAAIAAANAGATDEEIIEILESPSTVDGDAQSPSVIYEVTTE